jgi:hypothetical protein
MYGGGGFKQNLRYIESIWNARIIQQSQPFFGAADDAISLSLGHRLMGRPEGVGGSRFHFDEDESSLFQIATDQVNLAAPLGSEVLMKQPISISAEIFGGYSFSSPSESQVRSLDSPASRLCPASNGKENTSEKPARTIVDGSGKAHGSVSFRGATAFHSLCFRKNRIVETRGANSSSFGLALLLQ